MLTDVQGEKFAYVTRTSLNNGILQYTGFVNDSNINEANTFSLGLLQMNFFYQRTRWYAGQFVRKVTPKFEINDLLANYFSTVLNKQRELLLTVLVREVDNTFNSIKIDVPVHKNGTIAFDYIEAYIKALEAERIEALRNYLIQAGLNDINPSEFLSENLSTMQWGTFNVKDLYGSATRGKRLKSSDRVPGALPFVTAGEAEQGVSAFIGNDVVVFKQNTVTIDMFGSAKYRSYNYGADDHVAVVHTEELTQRAAIFVASALNKAAHTGSFDYSHNFYAKDADALTIKLPVDQKGNPDYKVMDNYIGTLEAGRINVLDKYLNDTGLSNLTLQIKNSPQ